MRRRYPLLILLSLLVLAVTAWNCVMTVNMSSIPFALQRVDGHMARVARLRNMPLPGGLHARDKVDFSRQDYATRLTLLAVREEANVGSGRQFAFTVTHFDGSHTTVAVPVRRLNAVPELRVSIGLGVCFYLLIGLAALLTLWRGRDRAGWAIAAWAIAFQCGMALTLVPANGSPVLVLGAVSQVFFLVARVGFFVLADVLVGSALAPRLRSALRWAFVAALVAGFGYEVTYPLVLVFGAVLLPGMLGMLWVVPYALAVLMLLLGHRNVVAEERQRLRWIFWSALILIFGIALSNEAFLGYPQSFVVEVGAYVIALVGLLYALLRHRVVDMSFIVNRALVYSATLTVVVAVFILLESFLEKIALSHNESLALELGVPLVLGFSLEAMRKRLERISERVFFRRRFKAEKALRDFAHHCGFIEHPDHLLERTLHELLSHTDAPSAALYWRDGGGYARLGESGETHYPDSLDIDDPAGVALRAERSACDLDTIGGALGSDGLVLPMTVHGDLLGLVAIRNRPGEHYPANECSLLEHLVQSVCAALYALHARENARFIASLAEGAFDAGEAAIRARALAQPG